VASRGYRNYGADLVTFVAPREDGTILVTCVSQLAGRDTAALRATPPDAVEHFITALDARLQNSSP
jgi:hypothetical protein